MGDSQQNTSGDYQNPCDEIKTDERFQAWVERKYGFIVTGSSTALNNVNPNINDVKTCISTQLGQLRSTNTEAPQTMEAILALQEQIKKKEEEILIAKDRARLAREGSQSPSYYESWFPLGRPVKPLVNLFFIAFSLFFLLVALFFGASLAGFTVTVLYPTPKFSLTTGPSFVSRFFSVFPPSFWLLLAIGGGILYYLFQVRGQGEKTA
jgi:hypothetical protein